MGRLAYAENDLEGAKKHFENALEAAGSSIAGIAKLGQVRRFRAASRTSLGDIALKQGKFKDASKFYTDAKKGAQDDKRLDLMWPAQRGLGRSLWLQAAQEKDQKKALSLRESALNNYRESLSKHSDREACAQTNRERHFSPQSRTSLMKLLLRMRR
jgi:tetratricopeptide (TPR) repeat protein